MKYNERQPAVPKIIEAKGSVRQLPLVAELRLTHQYSPFVAVLQREESRLEGKLSFVILIHDV